uniref:Putative secreted protein n=1 Tax=Panstrongylus lignarius TaxID=156445 RepID=A0A224Y472_9HEMI
MLCVFVYFALFRILLLLLRHLVLGLDHIHDRGPVIFLDQFPRLDQCRIPPGLFLEIVPVFYLHHHVFLPPWSLQGRIWSPIS